MSEILVIGHRNPDTDAICSAIGYAEFKRRTGMTEAIAARCGDTNDRIDFVLNTFGVPAPKFVAWSLCLTRISLPALPDHCSKSA